MASLDSATETCQGQTETAPNPWTVPAFSSLKGMKVARLAGFEPTTSASAGLRSIQLSYKRLSNLVWCRGWDLNPHARKDTTP